ncbi:glutathione S-transferase N-terminal domain-containing protein [Myxococcus hansupus]|uniref:glutathione S-transferase N-terminal domain-containing protein n=1 Tax=Pseudomyxococcus hansupus TaxID=1297742 RepID=UPI000A63B121|nr:glutathione S-transferase N-terminal domain-containing protein [Myxococcus hansupus]
MRTLYGLSYSGWTEKARWALDHHRVAYRYHEHLPLLGEPLLRWRTPRGTRPAVPLLIDDGEAFPGSFTIARRAEELGQGEPLFSAADLPAIQRWEADSEQVLSAARARVVARLIQNPQAQAESLPAFLPSGSGRCWRPPRSWARASWPASTTRRVTRRSRFATPSSPRWSGCASHCEASRTCSATSATRTSRPH